MPAKKKKKTAKKVTKKKPRAKAKPKAKAKVKAKAKAKATAKAKAKPRAKRRRNSMAYGIRSMGPMRLASVVDTNPGTAWHTMFAIREERGLKGQALAAFTMSDEKTIKSYAASVVVDESTPIEAPLVESRIDQSSYAYTSFVGPYDKLGETWGWFVGHVKHIGHTIDMSRMFLEIYKSDGKKSADGLPRTELCVPV